MTSLRFEQHRLAQTTWHAAYLQMLEHQGWARATAFRDAAHEEEPFRPAWQLAKARPTRSRLLCCGAWHAITQMPLRCLRCGRVHLAWSTTTPQETP